MGAEMQGVAVATCVPVRLWQSALHASRASQRLAVLIQGSSPGVVVIRMTVTRWWPWVRKRSKT